MIPRAQLIAGVALLCSAPGVAQTGGPPPDVVVYVSDQQGRALSEFDLVNDPASPGGKMAGTTNTGEELDPPPENDPHVTFTASVQRGVPYRCWIHMKVAPPKGVSKGNVLWVQFSDAVDATGKAALKPGTASYLTAHGPTQPGWAWVGCDRSGAAKASDSLIQFGTGGEVTVRVQAGMEGVGFDQLVLSPGRFLDKPPSEAVVQKQK
jgi:hypothetical protein